MDFGKILASLRQEKEAIEQAILSLEKLQGGHRRGRPPGTASSVDAPRKRGRPKGSRNRSSTVTSAAIGAPPI